MNTGMVMKALRTLGQAGGLLAALALTVLCAPVLLAGEDVPVNSLIGKIVRASITHERKGPELPLDLPRFPVRQCRTVTIYPDESH